MAPKLLVSNSGPYPHPLRNSTPFLALQATIDVSSRTTLQLPVHFNSSSNRPHHSTGPLNTKEPLIHFAHPSSPRPCCSILISTNRSSWTPMPLSMLWVLFSPKLILMVAPCRICQSSYSKGWAKLPHHQTWNAWAIEHFRHYLLHAPFTLRTDHGVLTWLHSFKSPSGQVARWLERLAEVNYIITHRPGKSHNNADSLSRYPHKPQSKPSPTLPVTASQTLFTSHSQTLHMHDILDNTHNLRTKTSLQSSTAFNMAHRHFLPRTPPLFVPCLNIPINLW